ncbi:hypothetical protein [Legionella lansingensis]|nr:hypothetical protein [Legionella lansingensis]
MILPYIKTFFGKLSNFFGKLSKYLINCFSGDELSSDEPSEEMITLPADDTPTTSPMTGSLLSPALIVMVVAGRKTHHDIPLNCKPFHFKFDDDDKDNDHPGVGLLHEMAVTSYDNDVDTRSFAAACA